MNKLLKFILTASIFIIMSVIMVYLVVLRYKNAYLTEMRMLLTFWKEYLVSIILMFGGYLVIKYFAEY